MNRATALCLTAVCFLSAGSAAHADQIAYSINTSYPSIFFDHGLGGIRLTDGSGVLPPIVGTPNAATISSNVTAFSFASPLWGQNISVPVNLTLSENGASSTVSLGTISGHLALLGSSLSFQSSGAQTTSLNGSNFTISSLSSTFSSGLLLTQGALSFTVVDPPINPPPTPPGSGSISSTSGPTSSTTPEPSSFVLAGIGVPLLGIFLRRRRRA